MPQKSLSSTVAARTGSAASSFPASALPKRDANFFSASSRVILDSFSTGAFFFGIGSSKKSGVSSRAGASFGSSTGALCFGGRPHETSSVSSVSQSNSPAVGLASGFSSGSAAFLGRVARRFFTGFSSGSADSPSERSEIRCSIWPAIFTNGSFAFSTIASAIFLFLAFRVSRALLSSAAMALSTNFSSAFLVRRAFFSLGFSAPTVRSS